MNQKLLQELIVGAENVLKENKRFHDIGHAIEVLKNVILVVEEEGGDTDILYPAALFHDASNEQSTLVEGKEGAEIAGNYLKSVAGYPIQKIPEVQRLILSISTEAKSHDEIIINDADELAVFSLLSIVRGSMMNAQKGRSVRQNIDDICLLAKQKYESFQNPDKKHTAKARELAAERYKDFQEIMQTILSNYDFSSNSPDNIKHD
jgi:HD superfamily phosphodiesterase